ncbi:MAG: uroporphyrinogen-III synthase [Lentisphaeraceae bacterium]|nr:uroporphyrinogen-III synthase [Lentisphaeraceae bacterium]
MNERKTVLNRILIAGTKKTANKAGTLTLPAILIPFPLLDTQVLSDIKFLKPEYDWLIFTSPAAVKHFCNLQNKPNFKNVAVIGPSSKKVAEHFGLEVQYMPETYNADCFGKALSSFIKSDADILFPCSDRADDTLESQFKRLSLSFERVNLYTPSPLPKPELPEFDAIAFLSASSAEAMYKHFGTAPFQGKKIAAIGNKAAKKVQELFGIIPQIPQSSTAENTIKELL